MATFLRDILKPGGHSPMGGHHPKVCLDLSDLAKTDTTSHVFIQIFNEIKDEHSYCTPIYPDGSKDNAILPAFDCPFKPDYGKTLAKRKHITGKNASVLQAFC